MDSLSLTLKYGRNMRLLPYPYSMAFRRHALAAFVLTALTAARADAAVPIITEKVMQCDGSYSAGTTTNHPSPKVRADIRSTETGGLRMGTVRMGVPSGTKALWRFSGGEAYSASACVLSATCVDGDGDITDCMWRSTYTYTYDEPTNNSDIVTLGACVYEYTNSACTTGVALVPGSSLVPFGGGLANCPATPPSGSVAGTILTAAGNGANFDNAAAFNGVQYGSVAYTSLWDRPATYTLSAWIKTTNATSSQMIIHQSSSNPAAYWGFGISNGGVRHLDSRDAAAPDVTIGAGLVTANVWHQIHVVRSNGSLRSFYVDGNLIDTAVAASTDSFSTHPLGNPVYIGATSAGAEGFVGDIDEIRVLDAALTADDVKLEYLGTHYKYSTNSGGLYNEVVTPARFVNNPVTLSPQTANTSTYTYVVPPGTETTASRFIFKAQSSSYTSTTVNMPYAFTIDSSKPSAANLVGAAGADLITWSWSDPSRLCVGPGLPAASYNLYDGQTATLIQGPIAASPVNETVVGANLPRSRRITATDTWGEGAFSVAATAYTLAYPPVSLALASVSTGGVVVSWNDNTNPNYTRYEFTYSPDNFLATTSTRIAVADNFTGAGTLTTSLTGLATGTTYYLRVRAFNGRQSDFSGGLATSFLTGFFVTRSTAPVLTGTALSPTSVRWDWTQPRGVSGYTLYDTPTSAVLVSGAVVTYTSATLSVNTRYDAEVEAYVPEQLYTNPQPTAVSQRTSAYVYTLVNAPLSPVVSAMYVSSGVFSWDTNGNPSYTNYELSIATHSNFKVVVATIGASGATATVRDLLPATSYYARVRAFNGNQIPSSFLVFAATMTSTDPSITVSSAPPSPYVLPSGLEGVWQFDEGSGLTSADGSPAANAVQFTCTTALCVSTPTFASGPAAFGTAASFSGLEYGVARTQNNFTAFNDDLTVSAWVYPQSSSQRDYAGLVAVGNKDSEDFALDIVSGRFRFLANSVPTVKAAWAPSSIAPGVWTHVVGVYDSAAAAATLYLNGASAATVTGVPARSNSGQRLSIGNRLSAAGAYTLPFLGRMDSVRVLRRALNAAEVLSDYQGGFVSTVTPSAPNSAVLVGLPPNAFTSPVRIFISADPASHPIKIPYATLNAGLASLPSGMTLVPNSVVEVVPVVDGLPFTAALGSSATVSIPYTDADGNNLVDGSALTASGIRMYTLDTTVNRWDALSTSVDPSNRRATGLTPHFSVFALFAPSTVGSGLSGVRVYPVPWKPGSGGRFDAGGLTFDNLPASGRIHILTLAGEGVADLRFDGQAAGLVTWDGRTKHGRRAASGVYFAKIVSDAGGSMLVKFAIER